jgi:hypothetical protein
MWIDQWGRDKNAVPGQKIDDKQGMSGVQVFNVDVDVEEGDPLNLNQGQMVWVHYPIDSRKNVTHIPKFLVRREGEQTYVWLVVRGLNDSQTAVKTEVQLGDESGADVIVLSGVSDGVLVEPPAETGAE